MGSIMVYRYRPMRVVPTITTSVLIARGSFFACRDIMVGAQGRQQAIAPIFYPEDLILRHFVAQIAACWELPAICGGKPPVERNLNWSECVNGMSETGMIGGCVCATLWGTEPTARLIMLHDLVDLGRYPIDCPGSHAYDRMIGDIQRELEQDGCAVLPGFVHQDGLNLLVQEADAVAPQAHRSFNRTNAYFTKDDPRFGIGHPIRRFYDRSNAFVPADNFPKSSPLRRIYEFDGFLPFIRVALDEPEDRFFRYDDPLADVIINVVEEGQGFPWHFDTNNFTVTLAIQNGEQGGAFEYAPNLRTAEDENFNAVASVLDGDMSRVCQLELQPGDLQIFKGRYSLHRVAPVSGARRRYVGIFSFVEAEGMCGGIERTRQLYGRVLPHHYEREGTRKDQLLD